MKLWHKILIATAVGAIAGVLLPLYGGDTLSFLRSFSDIFVSIGTYALVPLVLTQVTIATYELRHEGAGLRFILRSSLLLIGSAFLLSLLGGVAVLIVSPERIPIIIEEAAVVELPSIQKLLKTIFASNALEVLSSPAGMMISVFVFAVILGFATFNQRANARPLLDLSESTARVFYQINRIIVEVLVLGGAVLSATYAVTVREIQDFELFLQIIGLVAGLTFVMSLVAYPLIIFFYDRRHSPFAWLRQLIAPATTGMLSGSTLVPLGFLMRIGNEDLSLQRRVWQWFYPLGAIIGRAGTAMVTTISFIVILRSYSSLEISVLQFITVVFSSMLVSFLLGAVPGSGVLVGLSMMSLWYGQGLEEGFLILQPAAPILISFAVFLDVATQAFIAYVLNIISNRENAEEHKQASSRFRDEFMLS